MITTQIIGLLIFALIAIIDLGRRIGDSGEGDLNTSYIAIIIIGLFLAAGVTLGTVAIWQPMVEYLQTK